MIDSEAFPWTDILYLKKLESIFQEETRSHNEEIAELEYKPSFAAQESLLKVFLPCCGRSPLCGFSFTLLPHWPQCCHVHSQGSVLTLPCLLSVFSLDVPAAAPSSSFRPQPKCYLLREVFPDHPAHTSVPVLVSWGC